MLIPKRYGGGGTDIVTAFKVIQEISRADGSTGWAFMANSCSAAVAAGFMNTEGGQRDLRRAQPGYHRRHDRAHRNGRPASTAGTGSTAVTSSPAARPTHRGSAPVSWSPTRTATRFSTPTASPTAASPSCRAKRSSSSATGTSWAWSAPVPTTTRCTTASSPTSTRWRRSPPTRRRKNPSSNSDSLGIGVGGHAPVALGLAQRALQEIAGIVSTKVRPGYEGHVAGDSDLFKLDFARNEAQFRAAQAFVYEVFGDAQASAAAGIEITEEQRARLRQATTWVQGVAGDIVTFAARWAGSATVRNPSALGRCVRDAAVATQHALVDRMTLVDAEPAIIAGYRK